MLYKYSSNCLKMWEHIKEREIIRLGPLSLLITMGIIIVLATNRIHVLTTKPIMEQNLEVVEVKQNYAYVFITIICLWYQNRVLVFWFIYIVKYLSFTTGREEGKGRYSLNALLENENTFGWSKLALTSVFGSCFALSAALSKQNSFAVGRENFETSRCVWLADTLNDVRYKLHWLTIDWCKTNQIS